MQHTVHHRDIEHNRDIVNVIGNVCVFPTLTGQMSAEKKKASKLAVLRVFKCISK